jgi:alanine racemase
MYHILHGCKEKTHSEQHFWMIRVGVMVYGGHRHTGSVACLALLWPSIHNQVREQCFNDITWTV